MREPLYHSGITDGLFEKNNPLRNTDSLYCNRCGEMLHASNNECMQPWMETGKGNYCLYCFPFIINRYNDSEIGLADDHHEIVFSSK